MRVYNLCEGNVGEPSHERIGNPREHLTSKDKWRAIVDEYGHGSIKRGNHADLAAGNDRARERDNER